MTDRPNERLATWKQNAIGRQVLATATVEQIANWFCRETQELPQIQALILAHGHFVSSKVLLTVFINEYKNLADDVSRIRLVNLIKKWVDLQRCKFENPDSELGKILGEWLVYLEQEKSPLLAFAQSLLSKKLEHSDEEDDDDTPAIIKKKKNGSKISLLVAYDAKEIARQMTLIDYEYLRRIDREEMLCNRWLETETSPTLSQASLHGNQVAHWFAHELLKAKDRHKPKYLAQFLRICENLLEMKNFQSLMCIYLGLNLPCLSRYALMWKELPSKSTAIWKKVTSILGYRQNFAAYREYTENLTPPLIPCQEILLKDLLYHNENTPDFVEPGVIDMRKLDSMGKMLDQFRSYQEKPPTFARFQELYEALENIPADITLNKLDDMAGIMNNVEITGLGESDSNSATTSGFFGESTSEADTSTGSPAPRANSVKHLAGTAAKLSPSFRMSKGEWKDSKESKDSTKSSGR